MATPHLDLLWRDGGMQVEDFAPPRLDLILLQLQGAWVKLTSDGIVDNQKCFHGNRIFLFKNHICNIIL